MAATISLAITQNSQSITNNTSNVTVSVTVKWSSGSWNATGECYGSITIDGATYNFSGIKFNTSATNSGSQVIMTQTVNVAHNADGTKTLSCSASFYTGLSSSGTPTASGSKTLTTIPRTTTPTLSASSTDMGGQVTIYTPRASSSFTHILEYSFLGSAYVAFAWGVGTSYTWTIPDLATSIPNAASGTLTIRCGTYNNGSTLIGTKTVTMTAKVPTSVVPTISAVSLVEAVNGIAAQFGAYVKNKSKVTASITAAGAKGSTIKSYSTTFQGAVYSGSSWTSGVLASSGTLSMTTTVTDSRGRTAQKTTTLPVLDYYRPAITKLHPYRTDGEYDPVTDGTWMAVELAYKVAPVGDKNTANMVLESKKTTDTEWIKLATYNALESDTRDTFDYIDLEMGEFSTDYQYDVRATLTDWFGEKTVYNATPLPSGAVILDIAADGLGISFGTTSDRAGTLFGWPAKGQVFGLGEALAQLPEGADLNEYHEPGVYSTVSDARVDTLVNCPSYYAGTFRVYNALGMGKHTDPWAYMIQEYRSYNMTEPTYRRLLQTNGEGVWTAGEWYS